MEEHSDSDAMPKKRTRGPTTCKKLKEKYANKNLEKTIEFDEFGTPIGAWRDQFVSYIGAVARVQVDINIESWDSVNQGLKDTMWEDIKREWNITDDMQKKKLIERMGKMWREFKAKLVDRKLKQGLDPCDKYEFISKEQWEQFKKSHETEEFQKISEKAKKNQKCNEHPHFMGKHEYAKKRVEWLVEDPIDSLITSESTIPKNRSGRSYDWVRARAKKKEEGGYFIPKDQTKKVFKKMEVLQENVSEGTLSPHGQDDMLTCVLGKKEHGGRVRGVGGIAGIREVFGREKGMQNRGVVAWDELATITQQITKRVRDECKEEMLEMQMKLRGLMDHIEQIGIPLPTTNFGINEINTQSNEEQIRSSCQSVEPDPFSDIQKPIPCCLWAINSESNKVIVARGTVYPKNTCGGPLLVHGEEVASDSVKVSVDDLVAEFQTVPLPIPSNELKRIGDAAGSFVQWPRHLVSFGQEPVQVKKKQKIQKEKRVVSKGSTTHKVKNGVHSEQNLSGKCQDLHELIKNLLSNLDSITIDRDSELFKCSLNKDGPIYVLPQDVCEFLRMSTLNVSILQIHAMYIHQLAKNLNVPFGIMCPSELALARERPTQTSTYITNFMLDSQSKPFILAPYIQNGHWMLILICLRDNVVYVFDSLNDTRNLDLRLVLSIAYRAYIVQRVRTGGNKSKLDWFDVECPQQGEVTKCGYYVMRFMYDIVMEYHKNPEIKWKEVLCCAQSYTRQHIDEIRELWAEFFMDKCL